jgi:hypothetical protein
MKAQIKIKNLGVTYFKGKQNEVQALKNINLEIFPRYIWAGLTGLF